MRFSVVFTTSNFLFLGVATVVSALPIAQSTNSLESLNERREGRGSFIATLKLFLPVLNWGLDGFRVMDKFERDFDDPKTVDICKHEPCPRFKIDLIN